MARFRSRHLFVEDRFEQPDFAVVVADELVIPRCPASRAMAAVGEVAGVLDACRDAGFHDVRLITTKRD
jgi:hypothetical protein